LELASLICAYPAESVLGRAAAIFVAQFPEVSVQVQARNWDELLRELRSRELDPFIAETSTLQQEQDLEIAPLPAAHPLNFIARSAHPLARSRRSSAMRS
jgi:DNA-binding transcriptional LysR family regulator